MAEKRVPGPRGGRRQDSKSKRRLTKKMPVSGTGLTREQMRELLDKRRPKFKPKPMPSPKPKLKPKPMPSPRPFPSQEWDKLTPAQKKRIMELLTARKKRAVPAKKGGRITKKKGGRVR